MSDSLDPRPSLDPRLPAIDETLDNLDLDQVAPTPTPAPAPPPPVSLAPSWRERLAVVAWLSGGFVQIGARSASRWFARNALDLALLAAAFAFGAGAVALGVEPADLVKAIMVNLVGMVPTLLIVYAAINAALRTYG